MGDVILKAILGEDASEEGAPLDVIVFGRVEFELDVVQDVVVMEVLKKGIDGGGEGGGERSGVGRCCSRSEGRKGWRGGRRGGRWGGLRGGDGCSGGWELAEDILEGHGD